MSLVLLVSVGACCDTMSDGDHGIEYHHGYGDRCVKDNVYHYDHGHKHYDHHILHEHNHHHHLDTHAIHDHLHKNSGKLDNITHLLEHTYMHNKRQDKMLREHKNLIHKQISMQKEDAERDYIQMEKQDQAMLQRKDIKHAVDHNGDKLNQVKLGQNIMMHKQRKTHKKLDNISGKVDHVMHGVDHNGESLKNMHFKMNAHDAAFMDHKKDMEVYMHNQQIHDQKLDMLKDMHLEHDAKQMDMMGQVLENGSRLGDIKVGQKVTHGMILNHAADMAHHVDNMKDFAKGQMRFNGKVAEHMDNVNGHMHKEDHHMMKQKKHMGMEKTHMRMEAIHMADADIHYSKDHEHHIHYDHHYPCQSHDCGHHPMVAPVLVGTSKDSS